MFFILANITYSIRPLHYTLSFRKRQAASFFFVTRDVAHSSPLCQSLMSDRDVALYTSDSFSKAFYVLLPDSVLLIKPSVVRFVLKREIPFKNKNSYH